jgi:hypothetical protein
MRSMGVCLGIFGLALFLFASLVAPASACNGVPGAAFAPGGMYAPAPAFAPSCGLGAATFAPAPVYAPQMSFAPAPVYPPAYAPTNAVFAPSFALGLGHRHSGVGRGPVFKQRTVTHIR